MAKTVGQDKWVTVSTTAATTEATQTVNTQFIVLLINDGTVDITFNFDQATTGDRAFVLKSGEFLADIPKTVATLYYKSASGTPAFRFWGIK